MNNKDLRMKYKRCCHCKYYRISGSFVGDGECVLKAKDFVFGPSRLRAHLCKAYELKD